MAKTIAETGNAFTPILNCVSRHITGDIETDKRTDGENRCRACLILEKRADGGLEQAKGGLRNGKLDIRKCLRSFGTLDLFSYLTPFKSSKFWHKLSPSCVAFASALSVCYFSVKSCLFCANVLHYLRGSPQNCLLGRADGGFSTNRLCGCHNVAMTDANLIVSQNPIFCVCF